MTRNLPTDPAGRQWSHPLMILLHCLWAKLNNKRHDQFECDTTWFCFYFDYCLFTCTVQLLFHSSLEIMQGVCLKLDVKGQESEKMLDLERGWGSWKLDNFHGHHMCIALTAPNHWMFELLINFFDSFMWQKHSMCVS